MGVSYPIDVVVPWVDGDDPVLNAKRARYLKGEESERDDIAGATRYKGIGEIHYCVASILRFAPFVRKIFIVTDGQDPEIKDDKVEVVDHKVIFKGHEEGMPYFNSNSIDTFIWNIPGLSEHFIYFNDDLFLVGPTKPEDYFRDGNPVAYGIWYPTFWAKALRGLKHLRPGHKVVGFKDFMLNGLELMGGGCRFVLIGHTPHALLKSWYSDFLSARPDAVELNMKDRFRSADQWSVFEPFYIDMARKGRLILVPDKQVSLYLNPRPAKNYFDRKIAYFDSKPEAIFLCANSLDKASESDRRKFASWLKKRIEL